MSLTLYRATVPVYQQMLEGLAHVLAKGAEFAKEREMKDEDFLGARIHPDMLPLISQIRIATDHAKGGPSRAIGIEQPVFEDNETTIAEAQARIAKAQDFLKGLSEEQFAGVEGNRVTIELLGNPVEFDATAYVLQFALPNFYFHVVTAYDILRAMGVKLGKFDFFAGKLIQE